MARVYESAEQFEALFTAMFDEIATVDPEGMHELIEQRMVIRFELRQPEVEVWIDAREQPVRTMFGPQDLQATLTGELTGNSMHQLLLGSLPLGMALMFRKLKVKGPKSKAMRLESLFHAMQEAYPSLVEEML